MKYLKFRITNIFILIYKFFGGKKRMLYYTGKDEIVGKYDSFKVV